VCVCVCVCVCVYIHTYAHGRDDDVHTYIHPFNGPLSGTTPVAGTRKVTPSGFY